TFILMFISVLMIEAYSGERSTSLFGAAGSPWSESLNKIESPKFSIVPSRSKICFCFSFENKESTYNCDGDITIWGTSPRSFSGYGSGSDSRQRRILNALLPSGSAGRKDRGQCAAFKSKGCWSFCKWGNHSGRDKNTDESNFDNFEKQTNFSSTGLKGIHSVLVKGYKLRSIQAISNAKESSRHFSKVVSRLVREGNTTHTHTH
uniref:Uncharacterized protein n=1 Tax=Sus scrofa TaxID=9823 RepID=A0A8D2C3Y5_PIG